MAKKPVLYYATLSPPSRSVLLTAAAIGVELELKKINLIAKEHLAPDFVKMNPQHTIPTLDDNGLIIVDSHAICTYLCDKYGKIDSLYPKDLAKRSSVDARLHFDTGFLFARIRFLYEPVFYFGYPEINQEKVEYIQKAWDLLEGFLANGNYLCGNDLTIADYCCIASVSSVDNVATIDAAKYPRLTKWVERMSNLPHYKEQNAEGAAELKQLFKDALKKNQLAATN